MSIIKVLACKIGAIRICENKGAVKHHKRGLILLIKQQSLTVLLCKQDERVNIDSRNKKAINR